MSYFLVALVSALVSAVTVSLLFLFAYRAGVVRIVLPNPVTGVAPVAPLPKGAAPAPVSKGVPAEAPHVGMSRVRVELFLPEGQVVPLEFATQLPAAGLAHSKLTIVSPDLPGIDASGPPNKGLPPISMETIGSLESGGALLVGRNGHVRPTIQGFEVMSRFLFELTVKDGRVYVSARKGMRDSPAHLEIGGGTMLMTTSASSIPLTGPAKIRQVLPSRDPQPKLTQWYFLVTPCL